MKTSHRLKQAKSIPEDRNIQDGTPESIRTSLNTGEWVTSIDLQDAYLHIPIHTRSRKYLRFAHRSQIYQFSSRPVGLSPTPQVFTMIVKLMALSRGIRIHQYLDDWLIRAQSREESSQHKSGGRPNRISRLDDKSGQIGVDSNSSILFCGIRIPSKLSGAVSRHCPSQSSSNLNDYIFVGTSLIT